MIFKNMGFTVATAAATLALTFAAPTGAGVHAETALATRAAATTAAVQFVPAEVVQPVAQTADETAPPTAQAKPASLRQLVAENRGTTPSSEQLRCLAAAVYFESRGEPLDGQLAVAQVIVNRAASGKFPASYCGVVTQKSQFSFVRGGRIPAAPAASSAWQNAVAIAEIAHRGLWDSPADDALYFHARYVRPGWSRTKLARATIDSHIFYR